MNLQIRSAQLDDIPELEKLIALSARTLGRDHYTPEQIEAALGRAWGVDTQLIADQTYFIVTAGETPVACGGWSKRKALFGSDALSRGEPELLDPSQDAARIRAFFVHPQFARRGLGTLLLRTCETAARAAGFQNAELVATLPGERLYAAHGYTRGMPFEYRLSESLTITFIPMRRQIRVG